MFQKIFFALVLIIGVYSIHAQTLFEPVQNKRFYHQVDRLEITRGFVKDVHSNLKGLPIKYINQFTYSDDSLSKVDRFNLLQHKEKYYTYFGLINESRRPLLNRFYMSKNDFYHYNDDGVYVGFNPVLNLKGGAETYFNGDDALSSDRNLWHSNKLIYNVRGFELKANFDDEIGVYTYLTDNAYNVPNYVDQRIVANGNNIFPGETWVKGVKEGELKIEEIEQLNTVEFFTARGYVSFDITKHIDFQFGHDKQFVGNGYRSLLLSDNSNAFFFMKLNTQFHKFLYQNLFYEINNWPERDAQNMVHKKFAAYHLLSVNINKNLNIGLFENVIFARRDTNEKAHMEFQYLNPVIFYKAVEHNMGSQGGSIDNNFIGIDGKFNFADHFQLYGQFLLDDISFQTIKPDIDSMLVKYHVKRQRSFDTYSLHTNKWATQLGLKYINVLGVNNFDIQIEHNRARPFTYAHFDTGTRYTHAGQSMAHPLGANFAENILIVRLQPYSRLFMYASVIKSKYGTDSQDSNWGGDLNKNPWYPGDQYEAQLNGTYYNSEAHYNSTVGQGERNDQINLLGTLSYLLKNNFYLDASIMYRDQKNTFTLQSHKTLYIMFGLRLNAFNVDHQF